jgi:hypothetical protein
MGRRGPIELIEGPEQPPLAKESSLAAHRAARDIGLARRNLYDSRQNEDAYPNDDDDAMFVDGNQTKARRWTPRWGARNPRSCQSQSLPAWVSALRAKEYAEFEDVPVPEW